MQVQRQTFQDMDLYTKQKHPNFRVGVFVF